MENIILFIFTTIPETHQKQRDKNFRLGFYCNLVFEHEMIDKFKIFLLPKAEIAIIYAIIYLIICSVGVGAKRIRHKYHFNI